MMSLSLRMGILMGILFGILYMIVTIFMRFMGVGSFYMYIIMAVGMMFLQYLIGPKLVEWMMRVKYVKKEEYPQLYNMVEDLAAKAGIPMPRIAVADMAIPNAFAFGRGIKDGRVCVTKGIMGLLNNEELKAVLGHEISHLKNRDVLFITLLSVIPIILYRIFWHLTFYSSDRRRENGGYLVLLGIAAFLFYLLTNLLVLYASRIREYFADKGAIELGNQPSALASALYKLVYGAARLPKEELRQVEGAKAFFLNDVSRAREEIRELGALDLDRSGTIDAKELSELRTKTIKLNFADKFMEILSTHPNMLKRINHLAQYGKV